MVKTTQCKGCGRKVIFAKDEEGKTQILDAVSPVYSTDTTFVDGTITVVRDRDAFVSHFITCPDRAKFSKAGGA